MIKKQQIILGLLFTLLLPVKSAWYYPEGIKRVVDNGFQKNLEGSTPPLKQP